MWLPIQAPPVHRPDLIQPHTVIDVTHGTADQLIKVRLDLMHGANFNDPPYFAFPSYRRMQQSAVVGGRSA
ncbi:cyanobactin biosynthesis system PatB/AcyB/McaB family protein [Nocardia sp. NPDC058666]|uniref:cyanobactin biosynthesis system PatB/AcyB/McaB family protein n=1 Tax=Nocardia sp. NPDC058666 TaxID=3346587 RepID=UPI00365FCA95